MKKKKEPSQKNIIDILKPFSTFNNQKTITMAYQTLIHEDNYPEIILFQGFKDIVSKSKNLEHIATQIIKKPGEKIRKVRQDTEAGFTNSNNKGRKKESEPFKSALEMLDGKTLKQWEEKFGIDIQQHSILKREVNDALGKGTFPIKITGFSQEAIDKMTNEILLLREIFCLFEEKLKEAKAKKNTYFINLVGKIFREDAKDYIEGKKGRGDKIKHETLVKNYKTCKQYILSDDDSSSIPKTFSDREKPTMLIYLARQIDQELFSVSRQETKKNKAKLKIFLLMKKYRIQNHEILSPSVNNSLSSVQPYSILGRQQQDFKDKTTIKKPLSYTTLINDYLKEIKRIDEQLEELKDI